MKYSSTTARYGDITQDRKSAGGGFALEKVGLGFFIYFFPPSRTETHAHKDVFQERRVVHERIVELHHDYETENKRQALKEIVWPLSSTFKYNVTHNCVS